MIKHASRAMEDQMLDAAGVAGALRRWVPLGATVAENWTRERRILGVARAARPAWQFDQFVRRMIANAAEPADGSIGCACRTAPRRRHPMDALLHKLIALIPICGPRSHEGYTGCTRMIAARSVGVV